jgi:hypothetical protein
MSSFSRRLLPTCRLLTLTPGQMHPQYPLSEYSLPGGTAMSSDKPVRRSLVIRREKCAKGGYSELLVKIDENGDLVLDAADAGESVRSIVATGVMRTARPSRRSGRTPCCCTWSRGAVHEHGGIWAMAQGSGGPGQLLVVGLRKR